VFGNENFMHSTHAQPASHTIFGDADIVLERLIFTASVCEFSFSYTVLGDSQCAAYGIISDNADATILWHLDK
jgi:hypothetical protein